MAAYKVLAPLFIEKTGKTYMPGHAVELSDAKAAKLAEAGIVEPPAANPKTKAKTASKAS